ncbi:hypothetical protein NHQ30_009554 [Ciborinia camelliae]|nr:hypothetical protein NHQ30_009554 [Ciborinia camelliae]
MYIPNAQNFLTAALGLSTVTKPNEVASGSTLDFAVEKCLDDDHNQRCTTPFLVTKNSCYKIEWSTEGTLSHTTVEVRDAGSGEMVFYRDTNGEWESKKAELVYLDFKPKIPKTGNDTVDWTVSTCK